jgi:hypothetical protein
VVDRLKSKSPAQSASEYANTFKSVSVNFIPTVGVVFKYEAVALHALKFGFVLNRVNTPTLHMRYLALY